jgi:nitrate reductase NapAB chaperone NapD
MIAAHGWRPVLPKRRSSVKRCIVAIDKSEVELVDLIGRLVRLIEDMKNLADSATSAASRAKP